LRAPLRHIGGFLEMLRAELHSVLQDNSQRYLEIIADAARQMEALIEDLLEFSRTGRAEMRCALVNTAGMVEEVLRELKPECRDRTIAWDIAELPEVFGDHSLLKQVWFNLLSNAIKYTRLRPRAEIRIGCVLGQGEVEFVVRDNGAGFDMKYADKLFGVFQRLHLPEEFEGTGIGLANVRRIVLRHGGRTWAEGEVDVGAIFHFTLPIKRKGEKDE
jgi:light-regulated signal transduction histidine kinase (bacteriophytochrome)